MLNAREKYEISDRHSVFYVSKDDKVSIDIEGEIFDLDCSFKVFKKIKTVDYNSEPSEYDWDTKILEILFHVERDNLDEDVSIYFSVANEYSGTTAYLFFEEGHKLYDSSLDGALYWFEKWCWNSGLDYSVQFYLSSEEFCTDGDLKVYRYSKDYDVGVVVAKNKKDAMRIGDLERGTKVEFLGYAKKELKERHLFSGS